MRNVRTAEYLSVPLHLTVVASCNAVDDCAVARRIFLSVRFKPE